MRVPAPRVTVGAVAGAAVALAPNSLPRELYVQVVLLWVSVVIGAALGVISARIALGRRREPTRCDGVVAAGALTVFGLMVVANTAWQSAVRSAMPGVTPLGPGWVLWSLTPAAVALVWGAMATRTLRPTARTAAAAVVAATLTATGTGSATGVDAAIVAPAPTPAPSVVAGSVEARTAGPAAIRRVAREVVTRWRASGGAGRSAVVVAVPTGSGWVDPDALAGFRQRFAGDVSVVTLAYDRRPSWQAFVGGTGPATDSAIALTSAVADVVAETPAERRPALYLYGQSLGAVGADAARRWALVHDVDVCATIVVGAPAGTLARHADRRVVIVNGSDPVARWSPSLLWSPPPPAPTDDLPRPPWFPVAGFVQTSVDLLGALSFRAGHGHQYGSEQGTRAPLCGPSTQMSPRAAS